MLNRSATGSLCSYILIDNTALLFVCLIFFHVQFRVDGLNKPESRLAEVGLLSTVTWVSRSPALAGAGNTEATDSASRVNL